MSSLALNNGSLLQLLVELGGNETFIETDGLSFCHFASCGLDFNTLVNLIFLINSTRNDLLFDLVYFIFPFLSIFAWIEWVDSQLICLIMSSFVE